MKAILKTTGKKDDPVVKELAGNVVIPDELKTGFTKEQFTSLVEKGIEIDNFIGGVEKDASFLEEDVPNNFPNSTIVDEETETQRKWKNYCVYHKSIDKNKVLIYIGERDSNGNRQDVVPNNELLKWIDYFGIDNIKTKHQCQDLLNSENYLIKENEQG